MNIYLVKRIDNYLQHEIIESFICVAKNKNDAKKIIPTLPNTPFEYKWIDGKLYRRFNEHKNENFELCEFDNVWCYDIRDIQVKKIGVANNIYKRSRIIHKCFYL